MGNGVDADADIHPTAKIGFGSVIGKSVKIERNVTIGKFVTIGDSCTIGANSTIEDSTALGYDIIFKHRSSKKETRTIIGKDAFIGRNCVVYVGSVVKDEARIFHNVILRENSIIGKATKIGHQCDIEGNLKIGARCSIFAQSQVGAHTIIEDCVFVGPHFLALNNKKISYLRPNLATIEAGPKIRYGARIGGRVTLLPGINVGKESFVAADSLVTRDVPNFSIAMGSPAKIVGKVPAEERLLANYG